MTRPLGRAGNPELTGLRDTLTVSHPAIESVDPRAEECRPCVQAASRTCSN
jgi:hypothetical protein